MTQNPPAATPPPQELDPFAAFLSYLIPGLGQIYQGRTGKGVLFLASLYGLFFYGLYLGQWQNVYMPPGVRDDQLPHREQLPGGVRGIMNSLGDRYQFIGQFWIGAAAWPAIIQYRNFDPNKAEGPYFRAFMRYPGEQIDPDDKQRERTIRGEAVLNRLQRNSDKRWDLGWVYTVIAGVLNVLVIYDALAGPAHRNPPESASEPAQKATVGA
jgi:Family of unknown function (DUF6677)